MASSSRDIVVEARRHYCHQCRQTVFITVSRSVNLQCPNCHHGFVQEIDPQNPREQFGFFNPLPSVLPYFPAAAPTSAHGGNSGRPFDFNELLDRASINNQHDGHTDPDAFDPMTFLHIPLNDLRSRGAHVQFLMQDHGSQGEFDQLPTDFFVDSGLEELVQQLAENEPSRYGNPPAAQWAVDRLPTIVVNLEMQNTNSHNCIICISEFQQGETVRQMPCMHMFHSDCILHWLELHNSCPLCRFELPTDDIDYEYQRNFGDGDNHGGQGGHAYSSGNVGEESRFRISLPWPFRSFGNNDNEESTSYGNGENSGDGEESPQMDDLD